MPRVYIGLGSNLGDRLGLLRAAEAQLAAREGIRVLRQSSVYETEPVGVSGHPWYLNQVLAVETSLEPEGLLDVLQDIEVRLGRMRTRSAAPEPRPIDIDMLLYGDRTIATPKLTVPHPEIPHRRFVLVPLLELDPHAALPDGRRARDLLTALGGAQHIRPYALLGG